MPLANDLPGKLELASLRFGQATDAGKPPLQLTATRTHLRQVFWSRNVVLVALFTWMGMAHADFSSPWVLAILAVAVLVNIVTWVRLRQPAPVTYGEFLVQILSDVALIGAGLHHSGGDASLAVLSFVPLTIAAATLPWQQTLVVFLAIFSLHELVCHYLPGAVWPDPTERRLDLLVGGLIASFVYCMARASRLHDEHLARMREKYLDQRHAAELGTMAASAVHQLSSPLATLAVLIGELRAGPGGSPEQRGALDVMARQIDICKQISSRLLAFTGHERAEGGGRMAADQFVARIVEKCRLMQPWMAVEHRACGRPPAPDILVDSSLEQAILVLLHASPGGLRQIQIAHQWDEQFLRIGLYDYGPVSSVSPDDPEGTPLFSSRRAPDTRHFDLLMARAAIHRFGGTIDSRLHGQDAMCMELALPLSSRNATPGTYAAS